MTFDPLLITLIAPAVLIIGSAIGLRFGLPLWIALSITGIVLALGGYALRGGVNQSCLIDESECVGATATAYVISAFWFMAVVILMVSAARNMRKHSGRATRKP